MKKSIPEFRLCGCCEEYHSDDFTGDCRDDTERWTGGALDERYEVNGWRESIELEIADDDMRLDHIPDVSECRRMLRDMKASAYWPNVWHINDHGNVDLLRIGWNGAVIVKSWV